ncbi:hypothetical protein [Lactobacillus sp. ESL0677]|uniref:hypothetical protein n=1 Tax=Lactobacillus sp. ESL0677 TaxID=2983208 RepID=UPI0023F6CAA4|nr:hypothetical protein [Lactobacillus sp. ESL0677]WEV37461.1 hypothetical protein OZX76_02590 [Lactobacillus sp. ESL0677]
MKAYKGVKLYNNYKKVHIKDIAKIFSNNPYYTIIKHSDIVIFSYTPDCYLLNLSKVEECLIDDFSLLIITDYKIKKLLDNLDKLHLKFNTISFNTTNNEQVDEVTNDFFQQLIINGNFSAVFNQLKDYNLKVAECGFLLPDNSIVKITQYGTIYATDFEENKQIMKNVVDFMFEGNL